ncbi:MAG: iron chelate uptake ABC transporter family permease subunit [Propionibacteriales bacterium]|nr:iron chelate uptake ABC transporter family permease subunit [Propionibacteriales bacterium]
MISAPVTDRGDSSPRTRHRMLTLPAPFHARIDVRVLTVIGLLALLALVAAVLGLVLGSLAIPLDRLVAVFLGDGTRIERTVVTQWRAPRVVAGLVLGAALGLSGAIFQSLTRNPLGSPDIIGFSTGAHAGGIITIIVLGDGVLSVSAGAIIGGLVTALVIYLLAWNRGVQGFRLIIVGIGVTAVISSINTWLIMRADLDIALAAASWGVGSLNGLSWTKVTPALIMIALASVALWTQARSLRQMEMGDDLARALGTDTERSRLLMIVIGVALVAVATAAAGPIAFVALAAPQIARRVTGAAGTTLLGSAVVGGLLLSVADLVAQHAFGERQVPVGVVTVSIGGLYLVWLLIHEARRQLA